MISSFISLYAFGVLLTDSIQTNAPHIMPWNENVLLETTSMPEKNEQNIAPIIKAKSAIVVDIKNGLVLYEKNIHTKLPIASLTKLMTTSIVLEENDIKEVSTISKNASKTEGSKIWLAEGEKITVENLLYASLINSANDSAVALAEHNSGTEKEFVKKMNIRAKELGMLSTNFVNSTGLDNDSIENENTSSNQQNYTNNSVNQTNNSSKNIQNNQKNELTEISTIKKENTKYNTSTAYDLTILARHSFGKSFIRRAVTKQELEIKSTNEYLTHKLKNTNGLLNSYLPVIGLKTGTTDSAGECLIAIIENPEGNDILTIVLNSPARYTESKILADWAIRTFTWR